MRSRNWMYRAALAAACAPGSLFAANTVLSGVFDGSESRTAPLPGSCAASESLAHQVVAPLQVSASGDYYVVDALELFGVDVNALVYAGNFNSGAPQNNLLTPGGIDSEGNVALTAGTNYTLVVQHWCENREGAWALTFSGPGGVTSDRVVGVPVMTQGAFAGTEPMIATECGESHYRQSGPLRVSTSGTYYYSDIFTFIAVDLCLHIHTAPIDAANPALNRVATLDDFDRVELEADTDYYFVAQSWSFSPTGDFFYVFAPPAPFRITHAMAGSWFDPPTSGQGFFMDVFDNSNQLFLAWFTYDLERPDAGTEALIGEPGHRWLTAQGPFGGNSAAMDIYWTSGMIFDSANPPKEQPLQDGSMTVDFFDCSTGRVTYDLGTANVQGQVPIQRLADDAVDLCRASFAGPGQPGPL